MHFLFINPSRILGRDNIWRVIKSTTPPIGLALLAALLEQRGIQSDIIDAQALQLTPDEVIARARFAGTYDIIGITATTPEIESAARTAQLFRKAFPNARILFGGVHPTLFHRQLVESGIADLVIRGEGEEPIVALALSKNLREVPDLTWKDDKGNVVVNESRGTLVNLDSLPLPAYHKLPMTSYRSALGAVKRTPSIGIITSRGCPGTCTFCYSGMFGNKVRRESADRIYEHIRFLQESYGIREISFYDDTFTSDRDRVIALCNRFIKEKLNVSWSCFARVDTVDPELLILMRQAGCHQIMYGFESSDDAVLKTINKRATISRYFEIVKMTRAAGIDIRGAFMLGSPGETEQSLINTISFSTILNIQYAVFNITTPYPGTALHVWAVKNACLIHRNWKDYDYAHPVMELPTLSAKTIQKYYREAYRTFYLRPRYIFSSLPGMLSSGLLSMGLKVFWGIISMLRPRRDDNKCSDDC
jgi:anaerobic magnesium-protoporphyrin IX monomethyl ester cyclase